MESLTTDASQQASNLANERYGPMYPHGKPAPGWRAGDAHGSQRAVRCGGVLVLNQADQILVGFNVKRQVWDLPQGVVEDDESPKRAAMRELLEETGLRAEYDELHEIACVEHQTREFVYRFENFIFRLRPKDPDSLQLAENLEPAKCLQLAWFAPCQLPRPRGLSLRLSLVLLGRTE